MRRTAAGMQALPAGMHPPFSFRSCRKENGPCTVQKKRPLRRAPARSRLCATGVGGSVQAPILACLRARYHLLRFLGLPSRGGWCGGGRGGYRMVSASLFAAAGCPARELVQRADEGIGPYGDAEGLRSCLVQGPTIARVARSEAERAERGTSGTLVTEILGAPQRETGKEELVKSLLAPRPKTHPRRGNPPSSLYRTPPRPLASPRKHAGTISRRPPYSNFARTCKVAAKSAFSLTPGAARSLFG